MEEHEHILVCMRMSDVRTVPPLAGRVVKCSLCDADVWKSDSSPRTHYDKYMCIQCMKDELTASLSDCELMAPTDEQIRDIERHFAEEAKKHQH